MIIDKLLTFSDAQADITASGASTSYVDVIKAGDALSGAELYAVVRVATALTSTNSTGTILVSVQTATDTAFTAPVTLAAGTATVVTAAGANVVLLKAKLGTGLLRYLRVYYTIGVQSLTGGTLDAFLTPDVDLALPAA